MNLLMVMRCWPPRWRDVVYLSYRSGSSVKTCKVGELKEVLAGHSGGEMPISALWPKNRQLLPKIRYVVDELVTAAEAGLLD